MVCDGGCGAQQRRAQQCREKYERIGATEARGARRALRSAREVAREREREARDAHGLLAPGRRGAKRGSARSGHGDSQRARGTWRECAGADSRWRRVAKRYTAWGDMLVVRWHRRRRYGITAGADLWRRGRIRSPGACGSLWGGTITRSRGVPGKRAPCGSRRFHQEFRICPENVWRKTSLPMSPLASTGSKSLTQPVQGSRNQQELPLSREKSTPSP